MLWRKLATDKKCPQLKRQTGITTLLFARSVWVLLSPSTKRLRDWANGLTSLSEKMRRSNHLLMLEQRQHLLLSYFKILSVGPARNQTRAFCTADWHLTNQANQAAVMLSLDSPSDPLSLLHYNFKVSCHKSDCFFFNFKLQRRFETFQFYNFSFKKPTVI